MNGIVAVLLVLHGLAHLVGFVGAFRLAEDVPHVTRLFFGQLEMGEPGIRVMGVVWLILAVAFVLAGAATWSKTSWWPTYTIGIVAASTLACLLALPDTRIGLPVNGLLLVATVLGTRWGWMVCR